MQKQLARIRKPGAQLLVCTNPGNSVPAACQALCLLLHILLFLVFWSGLWYAVSPGPGPLWGCWSLMKYKSLSRVIQMLHGDADTGTELYWMNMIPPQIVLIKSLCHIMGFFWRMIKVAKRTVWQFSCMTLQPIPGRAYQGQKWKA